MLNVRLLLADYLQINSHAYIFAYLEAWTPMDLVMKKIKVTRISCQDLKPKLWEIFLSWVFEMYCIKNIE